MKRVTATPSHYTWVCFEHWNNRRTSWHSLITLRSYCCFFSFLKIEDQWWRHERSPCCSVSSHRNALWNRYTSPVFHIIWQASFWSASRSDTIDATMSVERFSALTTWSKYFKLRRWIVVRKGLGLLGVNSSRIDWFILCFVQLILIILRYAVISKASSLFLSAVFTNTMIHYRRMQLSSKCYWNKLHVLFASSLLFCSRLTLNLVGIDAVQCVTVFIVFMKIYFSYQYIATLLHCN